MATCSGKGEGFVFLELPSRNLPKNIKIFPKRCFSKAQGLKNHQKSKVFKVFFFLCVFFVFLGVLGVLSGLGISLLGVLGYVFFVLGLLGFGRSLMCSFRVFFSLFWFYVPIDQIRQFERK